MWSKGPRLFNQYSNKSPIKISLISCNTARKQITVLNKLHKGRAAVVEITNHEAVASDSTSNMSRLRVIKYVAAVINQSTRGVFRNHQTSTHHNNTSNTTTTLRRTTMLRPLTTSNKTTMTGHKTTTTAMDKTNTTKKFRHSSRLRGRKSNLSLTERFIKLKSHNSERSSQSTALFTKIKIRCIISKGKRDFKSKMMSRAINKVSLQMHLLKSSKTRSPTTQNSSTIRSKILSNNIHRNKSLRALKISSSPETNSSKGSRSPGQTSRGLKSRAPKK